MIPENVVPFTSQPLPSDVLWVGQPHMRFFVASPDNVFPIHVQIYEVDTLGGKHFINRINFTARNWAKKSSRWIDIAGVAHAHLFHRGNRIRIEVRNVDRTNRPVVAESPFVLPLFRNARATISIDARHPSFIELPLVSRADVASQKK